MKKLVFVIVLSLSFIGCTERYIYENLESFNLNGSTIIREQFSFIIPDDTGLKNGWRKQYNIPKDNIVSFSYNKPFFETYFFRIHSRSAENCSYTTQSMLPIFGKKTSYTFYAGLNERDLKRLEAIKNKNEEYLKLDFLEDYYWNKDGIISAKFSNVNQYSAIEIMTEKEYKDKIKYQKIYYIYTYTETGKLKEYKITISANINKLKEKHIQTSVEYSFEDMIRRSQRTLDSLKLTNEDLARTAYCGQVLG